MEVKYPVIFRVFAVLNILGGMLLAFFTAILIAGNTTHYKYITPFVAVTAIWYIVSAFYWFFSAKKSVTFLFITALVSLGLAVGIVQDNFFFNYRSETDRIVFGSIAFFFVIYAIFNLIAAFTERIKSWREKNDSRKLFKPGIITSVFILSLFAGAAVPFMYDRNANNLSQNQSDDSNQWGEETYDDGEYYDEVYYDEEYYEDYEFMERSFSETTLISLYDDCIENHPDKHPYDYPYATSGKTIKLNGVTIGEYYGGPNGLRYEIFPVICAYSDISFDDFWDMFQLKSEVTIFSSLSSPDVFNRQSEVVNSTDQWLTGYSYKEVFIQWIYSNFIPNSDDVILGKTAQTIYDVVYRRFFRLMVDSYLTLNNELDTEEEIKWYKDATQSENYLIGLLEERYSGLLNEYTEWPFIYGNWYPHHGIAFWIRRKIDGNERSMFQAIQIVMDRFDADWYYGHFTS